MAPTAITYEWRPWITNWICSLASYTTDHYQPPLSQEPAWYDDTNFAFSCLQPFGKYTFVWHKIHQRSVFFIVLSNMMQMIVGFPIMQMWLLQYHLFYHGVGKDRSVINWLPIQICTPSCETKAQSTIIAAFAPTSLQLHHFSCCICYLKTYLLAYSPYLGLKILEYMPASLFLRSYWKKRKPAKYESKMWRRKVNCAENLRSLF